MKKILKLLIGLYCLFFMVGCSYHTTRTYSYSYGINSNEPERTSVKRPQYTTIPDEYYERVIFEKPRYKVVPNYIYSNSRYRVGSIPLPTYVCY